MKKHLLVTLVTLFSGLNVHAQCNPAIPSTATVVDSTMTINGGFTPAWVCSGDTLISNGGIFNIYLEPGAYMTTGGGIDTIFVRKSAKLFMNGGIHYIYYEDNLDLNLAGGIPTIDSCPSMSFDYTNAPLNGCFTGPVAYFHSSDSSLCEKGCIDFINQSINGITYQWFFPGGNPSSSTSTSPQNICYDSIGVFDVTLIVSNGNGSDTLTLTNFITVNGLPAVTVTQNGNVMTATPGFASYQWYFGNILINGATTNTLNGFQNGTYYVHVTGSNGCETIFAFVYNYNTGINQLNNETPFAIAPNPATESFTISFDNGFPLNQKQKAELKIYDAFGKKALVEKILLKTKTEISLKNIPAGIYFVEVFSGEKMFVEKLVVE